ncbi:hypothetical protein MT325_m816R [Paramecium bursaria chlorella virus MT325]|uniref:Uncharacterized protein m816R n=1 Tax=Paramecium bursaria Chlorella virus MT325 TaxID=346932 RepID=A7IVJ6_PBCVM|nr:hypothetical protein MT325_m816R [Paramecium bursaria chlorella virus MT325]
MALLFRSNCWSTFSFKNASALSRTLVPNIFFRIRILISLGRSEILSILIDNGHFIGIGSFMLLGAAPGSNDNARVK